MSSSAHVNLIPWLLGSDYARLDPELRKAFEVALHAGTLVALLGASPGQLGWLADRRRMKVVALACLPGAAAGYAFHAPISRRLGTPRGVAWGLIAGGLAMLAADASPHQRRCTEATPADGWWLGLAQACALVPGISRHGATLVAARLRGFSVPDSARLSLEVGLPMIAGAALLELQRLARRRLSGGWARGLAAGAGASMISAQLSLRVTGPVQDRRWMRGFAVYRIGLGTLVLALRPGSTARRFPGALA